MSPQRVVYHISAPYFIITPVAPTSLWSPNSTPESKSHWGEAGLHVSPETSQPYKWYFSRRINFPFCNHSANELHFSSKRLQEHQACALRTSALAARVNLPDTTIIRGKPFWSFPHMFTINTGWFSRSIVQLWWLDNNESENLTNSRCYQ